MMQSWEKQINKDIEDRRRTVLYTLNFNKERDNLLKSAFDCGLMQLTIPKKGSEIKEKLSNERIKVGESIVVISAKMIKLLSEIAVNTDDNVDCEDENSKGVFSYTLIHSQDTDIRAKMQEYNNYCYKYQRLRGEVKYINTLMSNIQDNKVYELSASILSELGF